MKRLVRSMITGLIITLVFTLVPFEGECREISNNVFRVHILANSDSEEDQNLKLQVRDALIQRAEPLLNGVKTKEDAMKIVSENLELLQNTASEVIYSQGFDYPVRLSVTNMYFTTRYYGDVTMPGGFYDALRVEIGKAEGKNWWCVMYPSLCLYSDNSSSSMKEGLSERQYDIVTEGEDYVFRFKIVEIFTGLCNKLSK